MLTFVAISALAMAGAQDSVSLSLYGGQPADQAGISLSPWGGGGIEESGSQSIAGSHSLLVRTATFFQGGTVKFASPVPVAQYASNPENLLLVSAFVVGGSGVPAAGGGGDRAGGAMAGGGAMGGGAMGGATQPAPRAKSMENLRLIIRTSDGKSAEAYYPLATATGVTDRWRRVGIPLSKIQGFAGTNKEITSISVAGDAPAAFYLGEVRVVTDQTPIQAELSSREMNLGRGQEVTLWAIAQAGFTVVEYSWDFDARDGLQDENTSQVVMHRFRVPGEYTVTCTVRDKFGIKPPWSGTIQVTVNP